MSMYDKRNHVWTFGAEHELADIPRTLSLPAGFSWDTHDITIVNSNGIANEPKGKGYPFGGEINTPPTETPAGQVAHLKTIKKLFPMAKVNYRSNLHVHVRVPGLRDDLKKLKLVQSYIHQTMRKVLAQIEPIPVPLGLEYSDQADLDGAKRRYRRRKVSHHTLLPPARLEHQLAARTLDQFYEREVPASKAGKPLWACQPRLCVNLRHLRAETETVEFRHFPGTLDENELLACVTWCERYLRYALDAKPIEELLKQFKRHLFPSFPPYNHQQEHRYRLTVHDGTVSKEQIAKNIQLILAGKL